jgi:hypothetical protein
MRTQYDLYRKISTSARRDQDFVIFCEFEEARSDVRVLHLRKTAWIPGIQRDIVLSAAERFRIEDVALVFVVDVAILSLGSIVGATGRAIGAPDWTKSAVENSAIAHC